MVGTTISHYKILEKIGQGGMGEVFLAQDTSLDRKVALKFLPEEMQGDPTARKRFLREAKSAAALDHPFVCKIYEVGEAEEQSFISMEYIQGMTLSQKLTEGPLPLKNALETSAEIAEALEAAHKQTIVHRDLKPSNIMLTPEGHVKVMDFGLAKRITPVEGQNEEEITTKLTKDGSILGTVPYMSPEQLRGREVDARSDIFSFGVVLYEMLAGVHPFKKSGQIETANSILSETAPPLSRYTEDVPGLLQHTVKKMLAKEPNRRYQLIHDVRTNLAELIDESGDPINDLAAAPPEASSVVGRWRRPIPWSLAAVLAIISTVLGIAVWNSLWNIRSATAPARERSVRFTLSLPPTDQFSIDSGLPVAVAMSADGNRIVYAARRNGVDHLYGRSLDELEAVPIPGTEGGLSPFFSPDGEWLGFYADGALKKVALVGGTPITIARAANLFGASWTANGTIVYATWSAPLMAVSADGGTPELVTRLDETQGETQHRDPHVLPNESAVLFSVRSPLRERIEVVELPTGERRFLVEGRNPFYVRTGHLVFARGRTVLAAPFNLERRDLTGPPVRLLDGVQSRGHTQYSVSLNGTLAYLPDRSRVGALVWVDREGRWRPATEERRAFSHPRLSPDETRFAVNIQREAGGQETWVYQTDRGTSSRLASNPATRPIWTPDGTRVTFQREGRLYSVLADGRDDPQLTHHQENFTLFPLAWSTTDGVLAYSAVRGDTNRNVWMLPRGSEQGEPFLNAMVDERAAMFSPDGQWVVYAIREQGVAEQIYVQPHPGPGKRIIVSTEGGMEPVWSPTGREIFYRSLDGRQLLVVDVETIPSFRGGTPKVLFEGRFAMAPGRFWSNYDVRRDGQEFLMIRLDDVSATPQLNVILDALESSGS